MSSNDVTQNLESVRKYYMNGEIEKAEKLLQKRINTVRLQTQDFMREVLDNNTDESVKDSILRMHFLNFV